MITILFARAMNYRKWRRETGVHLPWHIEHSLTRRYSGGVDECVKSNACAELRTVSDGSTAPAISKGREKNPITILHVAFLNGPPLMLSTDKESAVALNDASCRSFVVHITFLIFASVNAKLSKMMQEKVKIWKFLPKVPKKLCKIDKKITFFSPKKHLFCDKKNGQKSTFQPIKVCSKRCIWKDPEGILSVFMHFYEGAHDFWTFFFVIIDSFERFGPFVDHFVWPFFILFLAVLVPFLARNPKKKIDFFLDKK